MNDRPTITICKTELTIKEFDGQRVVTFRDVDTLHQRPEGTARRNFNTNKTHFLEGTDFFVQNPCEAAKEFDIVAPNGLTLFTETGYLMLVKSFTDDLTRAVQRQLVNLYFHVTEQLTELFLERNTGTCQSGSNTNVPPLQSEFADGIARLICAIRTVMQDNGHPPEVISQTIKSICDQFGLKLPPNFVRIPVSMHGNSFGFLSITYKEENT